jgi:hypothetical protein
MKHYLKGWQEALLILREESSVRSFSYWDGRLDAIDKPRSRQVPRLDSSTRSLICERELGEGYLLFHYKQKRDMTRKKNR